MRINNLPKKVWILTGNEENWEIAVRDKVWGVKEGRPKSYWDKLEKGDLLLFYAKSPIGGLIGLGLVDSKFKQDKPLWPDEIREKRVIYPYRFGFNIIYYLPDSWQEKNIFCPSTCRREQHQENIKCELWRILLHL